MYPFRRILIPTDFSTASQWAFDHAVRIATANDAEILILHIRRTWEKEPDELRFPADPTLYEYAEKQELDILRQRVQAHGAKVATRLIVKNAPEPGPEICRTVTEENVDLVVIATHARHHVAHLLIGSTTMAVINDPPVPILAIRYGVKKRDRIQRMVVPVHLKQQSRAALDLATSIARRRGTELHLITLCNDNERVAAQALLDSLKKSTQGITLRTEILSGTDVEREIVRYSHRNDADVIFLNAEQQLGDAKLEIIRHAATPVMIVPAPEMNIRTATEADIPLIFEFIKALAEYERLADRVVASEEKLRATLFGHPRFAEVLIGESDGEPVGFALFFHNYSTFLAQPGIYLEDLFVRPEARGRGFGKALLARLAAIAKSRNCGRLEWAVLNWNQPSIDFYESLGAKPMDEWKVYRLTGDALDKLARSGK